MAEAAGALTAARPPGRLADNIMHFARLLRRSGLPVGPGQVLDAIDAAQCGGLASRADFYWTLHAVLVRRHEHSAIFDQAFDIFWRRPKVIEQLMEMFFQQTRRAAIERPKRAGQRRVGEALLPDPGALEQHRDEAVEIESLATASAAEVLRTKDFEQMTAAEEAEARRAIARMRHRRLELRTRRFTPARDEAVDMRSTLKRSLRSGGQMIALSRRGRRRRGPPLVVLADISGSMANYTRMFLHFLHALKSDRSRMHVFVFGTRLTNITRELERRDVDEALARVCGGSEGLVGRHPDRPVAQGFQFFMESPRAGAGGSSGADERRARTRRAEASRAGDGAARPRRQTRRLAQPALALRGVRGRRRRHPDDAAPYG